MYTYIYSMYVDIMHVLTGSKAMSVKIIHKEKNGPKIGIFF